MSNIFDELTGAGREDPPRDMHDAQASASPNADEGSATYTSRDIKAAVQELLKYGLLEADRKPNLYSTVTTHQVRINEILEPLDLHLRIDDIRGLAFVAAGRDLFGSMDESIEGTDDDWHHPLVRRQRLTLEQSLLVAILRQMYLAHEQEAGVGARDATVSLDDLWSSLQVYIGASGSDARDEKRLRSLLEALRSHGIVSEIDETGQVTVRPIITHLASPESLEALLAHLTQLAHGEHGNPGT